MIKFKSCFIWTCSSTRDNDLTYGLYINNTVSSFTLCKNNDLYKSNNCLMKTILFYKL